MEALGVGLLIIVAFLSLTSVYLLRWVTHIPYYPTLMALNIFFVFLFLQKVSLLMYLFIWLHRILVVPYRVFCCSAHTLQLWCEFGCSMACGILLHWPGIKPLSPALQARFLTIGPPGKSQKVLYQANPCHKSPTWLFINNCSGLNNVPSKFMPT